MSAFSLSTLNMEPLGPGAKSLSSAEASKLLKLSDPAWRVESRPASANTPEEVSQLVRTFSFGSYKQGLAFVNAVAELAETHQHHPQITFGFGEVEVAIWTHDVQGLHSNDFVFSAKVDVLFRDTQSTTAAE